MAKKQTTKSPAIRTFKVETHSEKETIRVAEKLVRKLPPNTLIALVGELGSGKTTFVKGLVRGVKSKGIVSSSSFTIQKIYPGIKTIYHLDLFRLKNRINLDDFLEPVAGEGIWAIEWADKIFKRQHLKKYNYVWVEFSHKGENSRILKFSIRGFNEVISD